jgi:hypothetical protein
MERRQRIGINIEIIAMICITLAAKSSIIGELGLL